MDIQNFLQRLFNEQQWRESKIKDLRNQWGYDRESPISSQGGIGAPIYSDSFPLRLEDLFAANHPSFLDAINNVNRKDEKWKAQSKSLPPYVKERFEINQGIRERQKDRNLFYDLGV